MAKPPNAAAKVAEATKPTQQPTQVLAATTAPPAPSKGKPTTSAKEVTILDPVEEERRAFKLQQETLQKKLSSSYPESCFEKCILKKHEVLELWALIISTRTPSETIALNSQGLQWIEKRFNLAPHPSAPTYLVPVSAKDLKKGMAYDAKAESLSMRNKIFSSFYFECF